MKINSSYPYPVLYEYNDDYVETTFVSNFEILDSFGQVHISADFTLDNQKIINMIDKGSCVYLIHIECPQTSYRKEFTTTKNRMDIYVPSNEVRGKLNVHSFIIANENIENYKNEYLNDWYRKVPISYEKGNLMAIGKALELTIFEDNYDLLNLPSIVTVTKSLKNKYMDVDFYSNNITILLPEKDYKFYASSANSTLKKTILSMVIAPALLYVFSRLGSNSEDLEDYTWYQTLKKIFEENNHKLEDVGTENLSPLKATQLILRNPINSSFEEIKNLKSMEE